MFGNKSLSYRLYEIDYQAELYLLLTTVQHVCVCVDVLMMCMACLMCNKRLLLLLVAVLIDMWCILEGGHCTAGD